MESRRQARRIAMIGTDAGPGRFDRCGPAAVEAQKLIRPTAPKQTALAINLRRCQPGVSGRMPKDLAIHSAQRSRTASLDEEGTLARQEPAKVANPAQGFRNPENRSGPLVQRDHTARGAHQDLPWPSGAASSWVSQRLSPTPAQPAVCPSTQATTNHTAPTTPATVPTLGLQSFSAISRFIRRYDASHGLCLALASLTLDLRQPVCKCGIWPLRTWKLGAVGADSGRRAALGADRGLICRLRRVRIGRLAFTGQQPCGRCPQRIRCWPSRIGRLRRGS